MDKINRIGRQADPRQEKHGRLNSYISFYPLTKEVSKILLLLSIPSKNFPVFLMSFMFLPS